MTAVPYQQVPFPVDHLLNSDTMMKIPPPSFSSDDQSYLISRLIFNNDCNRLYDPLGYFQEQFSICDSSGVQTTAQPQLFPHSPPSSSENELSSLTVKQSPESGSGSGYQKGPKRKPKGDDRGSCSNSAANSKVGGGRGKKQKKCNRDIERVKEEDDHDNTNTNEFNTSKDKKVATSPTLRAKNTNQGGYIHVRARRGQATDSHSLAERVRREKIGTRMKLLQALVPGCDKVSGKAMMLDEIINYVQSLQSQVEFLSMKLAYLSPMIYNYGAIGVDHEALMLAPEGLNSMGSPLPPATQQCSPNSSSQTLTPLTNASFSFQQEDSRPSSNIALCLRQDTAEGLLWGMGSQGAAGYNLINQS